MKLSKSAINMAEILHEIAPKLKDPTFTIKMANWWDGQAMIHLKREHLRSTNLLIQFILFPYFIYKERQTYNELEKWGAKFDFLIEENER